VFIPHSFQGTITLPIPGRCAISDEILRNHTPFSEVGKKCVMFVGDLSPVVSGSGTGMVEWVPDELRVKTEGIITIKYLD